ncbi:hypothetical protein SELR_pSRC300290 (plasmid) [Selenomonas ruminantium subsp. lactilytica TAM6421]|uniref:Uncharacterized protein n=1 Tax=Selenomonas ruminantium subsp. lactilytica (strain NBRC 103574 / TAM6421) TaxID=927704 RepID=I0GWG5_SELRL|nr:hypothetical protein [Selenomonas ruminantium]BAL85102.1 hypothetical protein SELR_pSRC300290 [Selenomonas ruminantium subsp. lactilytica TAM6421]
MSELANVMQKTARGIMDDIRSDWSKHKRPEGNAEIDFHIVKDDYDVVRGEYVASGQKMWILEHGSGSKMDNAKENPDLPAYKRSELWNKERGKPPGNDESGTEIRTRGPYQDLDGNWHQGSSAAMPHGLNLEWQTAGGGKPWAKVRPIEGQHIVKENVTASSGKSARIAVMEDDIFNALGAMADRYIMRGEPK